MYINVLFYSNLMFINAIFIQRFKDECELGVAWNEDLWTVQFRVRPDVWVNIHAVWDRTSGLTLLTPSYKQMDSTSREFTSFAFDSFMAVEIGLYTDGRQVTDASRFEIASFRMYDWQDTSPSDSIGMKNISLLSYNVR